MPDSPSLTELPVSPLFNNITLSSIAKLSVFIVVVVPETVKSPPTVTSAVKFLFPPIFCSPVVKTTVSYTHLTLPTKA